MKNSEYWPFNTEIKERCILEIRENLSRPKSCQRIVVTSTNSQTFPCVPGYFWPQQLQKCQFPNGTGDFHYANWGFDLDVFPILVSCPGSTSLSVCHFLVWVLRLHLCEVSFASVSSDGNVPETNLFASQFSCLYQVYGVVWGG